MGWTRPPELRVHPDRDRNPDTLLKRALDLLGAPYVYGDVGRKGYDCSSFVCRVYAQSGWALPRVSRDQAKAGRAVSLDALAPGDLLFFASKGKPISHVGLYLGDGAMVHASSGQGKIVVQDLSTRWFRTRLVAARRILDGTPEAAAVAVTETIEHRDGTALTPFVRLRALVPEPPLASPLAPLAGTGLGLRSHLAWERSELGFVLTPEASLIHPPWGLEVTLAVPVRMVPGEHPTIGEVSNLGEALTRFIRTARVGLPGAEIEIALERNGSYRLSPGELARDATPSLRTAGVPGATVQTSPLSLFGAYRGNGFELSALLDDVVEPSLLGAGGAWHPRPWLSVDGAVGVGGPPGELESVGGAELGLGVHWNVPRRGRLGVRASVEAMSLLTGSTELGGAANLTASGRIVTMEGRVRVGLDIFGGWLTDGAVARPFGATFFGEPQALLDALEGAESDRFRAGGQFVLRVPRVGLRFGWVQGLGEGVLSYDDEATAVVELGPWSLGGRRVLDLRAGWASRGVLAGRGRVDVGTLSARLRLTKWLQVEVLGHAGEDFALAGGLALAWVP